MIRRPPRSTLTAPLLPDTTLFRSVRRLLENGANSSFVHQLADTDKSDSYLLADPVERIEAIGGTPHPSIPLPRDLFQPERLNSAGMDLDDRDILAIVQAKVRAEVAVEMPAPDNGDRSEERRVGKECVSTCRSRGSPYP